MIAYGVITSITQALNCLLDPEFMVKERNRSATSFWKELPRFDHLWSDLYPAYLGRTIFEAIKGAKRDMLCVEHIRSARIEAQLVNANLAGISID
jgi:hypothetical protein